MGFSFRKSKSLGKGLRLNLGKKGVSVSVKVGNTTFSSTGRVTTRIAPGISYSTSLKRKRK
ncbi:DUF4236 domain-containing protein [Bifidobacterium sp. 82T10]|uniref:DUF4236 domain-containing protein n=1 Tax=Bifidobacterium miconis TaxID=2834435 RepID=A0ABS6WFA6_9BIFI|nr:DUF4236 domain-containing protein [Bifidobacterium miconis]MBW3092627.1 DUF4236 domain-containing protein [Bifidobacterium miconis]